MIFSLQDNELPITSFELMRFESTRDQHDSKEYRHRVGA